MDKKTASAVRILVCENDMPELAHVEPLDFLSKEGIAAFSALSGGDDLRHYCEYLKARGYYGDAYADFLDRDSDKERVRWAINACRKVVKYEGDFRAYMLNPDKLLSDLSNPLAINSAACVTLHG